MQEVGTSGFHVGEGAISKPVFETLGVQKGHYVISISSQWLDVMGPKISNEVALDRSAIHKECKHCF